MTDNRDLFSEINNAILDLQGSQLQTFERPLKALARLLHHPDLDEFNQALIADVNLDEFLTASEHTGGGMVGSHQLLWPEERQKQLGLTLLLIDRFAENPDFATEIGYTYFYSGSDKLISGIHSIVRQLLIPFARDYKAYILAKGTSEPRLQMPRSNRIFIVHGREDGPREAVARFLEGLGFEPIILHEQANQGRTVIEKVEAHSDVGFAVVILTPDDEGGLKGAKLQPRARQNVLLELGYFIGRLTRSRVCTLKAGEMEIPSDWRGVVDEPFDTGGGWRQTLARELEAAGYQIDWNKVMSRRGNRIPV